MAQLKSTNILGNLAVTGEVVASSIKIPGSTGFLKADGSIDTTAYTTATGHTHSYAGATTAGGAANYAQKIETYYKDKTDQTYGSSYVLYAQWYTNDRLKLKVDNYPTEVDHSFKLVSQDTSKDKTTAPLSVGSATQPTHFSGGVPVACTYSLGATVPSNAIFTDAQVATTKRTNQTYNLTAANGATTGGLVYDQLVQFGTTSGQLVMGSCSIADVEATGANITATVGATLKYDSGVDALLFVFE